MPHFPHNPPKVCYTIRMKANYHTHSTWCDGKDSPEAMVRAALEKGFSALGFTSHALLPHADPWTLQPHTVAPYVDEIRAQDNALRKLFFTLARFVSLIVFLRSVASDVI